MMSGLSFSVVTGLLYPFAVVATCTGVASWLANYRSYSDFIRGSSGNNWLRHGLVAGLVLCLGGALSFRPIPHFAAIVGYLGSLRSTTVAGLVFGLFMLSMGWPVESALACFLSAPVGRALSYLGRFAPSILVLYGGVLVPLSWSLGWIPEVSFLHVRALTPTQLGWMAFALSMSSALQSAALLWVLEYLAGREERRGADVLWRMSEMFDGILSSLREPLPNPTFCRTVSKALRADSLVILPGGEASSSAPWPIDAETNAAVEQVLSWGQPYLSQRESGGTMIAIGLDDGEERLGVLALRIDDQHPLARAGMPLLRALSALFTSELASQRIQYQQSALEHARYRMLVAQIRPHFLYNSLTSVASLTQTDPQKAHDLLIELAQTLRHRFSNDDEWTTLGREMEGVYSYLSVEKARLGERLKVCVDAPPSLFNYQVPAVIIQPLVENAVRHGIAGKVGGGTVTLSIALVDGRLRVRVEDNGVGFEEEMDGDAENKDLRRANSGTLVGLSNVRQRLKTVLAESYNFHIRSTPEAGTTISFSLPARPAETPAS